MGGELQVKLLVYEKPKLLESEVNAFLSEMEQKGQVCHSIRLPWIPGAGCSIRR